MSRGNSWSRRKALSLLVRAACLSAVPGCGGEPDKAAPPPPQSSNSEMVDFMKSQQKTKKQ